jgi:1L-myo-inositol 1-phosphate cytidylyltransferase / CDP-L-myo-inositol myo-inositolphosphotransferase
MSAPQTTILPLIRFFSRPATAVLAKLPISPNQITAASLVLGLGAAGAAMQATQPWAIAAGLLMTGAYVLDNCDGEIARLKNQGSRFGMYFDTFVDWAVHTAFFWALGVGMAAATQEAFWNWLGMAAAVGGTINYGLGFILAAPDPETDGAPVGTEDRQRPQTPGEWILFAFRELTRADFCFIVLAFALFDALWVLLPTGAIGAQVYWLTATIKRAREFHV